MGYIHEGHWKGWALKIETFWTLKWPRAKQAMALVIDVAHFKIIKSKPHINYLLTYDASGPVYNRFPRGEWITWVSGGDVWVGGGGTK